MQRLARSFILQENFDAIVQFAEVPKLMRLASNEVFLPDPDRKGANQVYPNPLVDYALAWLDLEPGEALVVEGKAPAATPFARRWPVRPAARTARS